MCCKLRPSLASPHAQCFDLGSGNQHRYTWKPIPTKKTGSKLLPSSWFPNLPNARKRCKNHWTSTNWHSGGMQTTCFIGSKLHAGLHLRLKRIMRLKSQNTTCTGLKAREMRRINVHKEAVAVLFGVKIAVMPTGAGGRRAPPRVALVPTLYQRLCAVCTTLPAMSAAQTSVTCLPRVPAVPVAATCPLEASIHAVPAQHTNTASLHGSVTMMRPSLPTATARGSGNQFKTVDTSAGNACFGNPATE